MQRFCGISNFMLAIDLVPVTLCFFTFSRIDYFVALVFYYVLFVLANTIILPAHENVVIQDGLDSFIPCGW